MLTPELKIINHQLECDWTLLTVATMAGEREIARTQLLAGADVERRGASYKSRLGQCHPSTDDDMIVFVAGVKVTTQYTNLDRVLPGGAGSNVTSASDVRL